MKTEIAMRLFSTRIITPEVASEQINALSDFEHGLFRPEKFGEVEPLRKVFDPTNLAEAVQSLGKPHGTFIYKQGRPARILGIIWNLYSASRMLDDHSGGFVPSHPHPLFCSHWTFDFDGKWVNRVGLDKVVRFSEAMFDLSGADFGFLTSLDDLTAKNYVKGVERQGLDPALGVPGLYWLNLFSARYGEWLGLDRLPTEIGHKHRGANEGLVLQFGASPDMCRDLNVLETEHQAIEFLGEHRFFDIRRPNRKLDAPDWTALSNLSSSGGTALRM